MKRLDFIESDHSQYIDLGIKANQFTGFEIDFIPYDQPTGEWTGYGSILGARTATNVNEFHLSTAVVSGDGFMRMGSTFVSAIFQTGVRMQASLRNGVYSDSTGASGSLVVSDFETPVNLVLFALNTNGNINQHAKARLFSLKLYDGDTLIRDFVPAESDDGDAGLYDRINEVFYPNAGTGYFVTSDRYTRLEYIESTGTQYIDTGITVDAENYNKLRFVCETYYSSFTGAFLANGCSMSGLIYYFGVTNTGVIAYGNGTSDKTFDVTAPTATKLTADFNPAAGEYSVGDTSQSGLTFATPAKSGNFYLFAYNNGSAARCHPERIYSCKVYKEDVLIRDFVPAKDNGGNIGLYDRVNDVFYSNDGTGVFSSGEVLPWMYSVSFKGLESGLTYYARVYPMNYKGYAQSFIGQVGSAIPTEFPAAPSDYILIDTYTSAQTWTAPEDGWYKIEVFGASGAGGNGVLGLGIQWFEEYDYDDDGEPEETDVYYGLATGGSGGNGGYSCSEVMLRAGDTVILSPGTVGADSTAVFYSSREMYGTITVTSGGNGGGGTGSLTGGVNNRPPTLVGGAPGTGGKASGGNASNIDGGAGSVGNTNSHGIYNSLNVPAAKSTTSIEGGTVGGSSSYVSYNESHSAENGQHGYIKVFRGNTNVTA